MTDCPFNLTFPMIPSPPPFGLPSEGITLPPFPPLPCIPCSFGIGIAMPSFAVGPFGNLGLGIPPFNINLCGCKLVFSGKTFSVPFPGPVAVILTGIAVAINVLMKLLSFSVPFNLRCPLGAQKDVSL